MSARGAEEGLALPGPAGQAPSGVRGHIFILVGPSGGGKTTLIRTLAGRAASPDCRPFTFIPSTTSRAPRAGEREGVDYHFVDAAAFEAGVAAGRFLEWQRVHDHRYGSSRQHLQSAVSAGAFGLIQADILGAFKIKAAMPADVTTVFVTPSRTDILRERILGRGGVTPEELVRRLARVEMEMQMAHACDQLVINDDLDAAVQSLGIVARGRRLQAVRLAHFGVRPVVRMMALAGAPSADAGDRFCVADCESYAMAALRIVRQWWWERHPGAGAFVLPPCAPKPGGMHVEERPEALLEVAEWDSRLTLEDWAAEAPEG